MGTSMHKHKYLGGIPGTSRRKTQVFGVYLGTSRHKHKYLGVDRVIVGVNTSIWG